MLREAKFSKREQDIVYQILADKCNKEIAEALGLSLNTIKVYLKNLMRKISVTSRAGIISFLLLKPSPRRRR
jgi:DNA-binding NarL/FixJ family response regulator